MPSYVHWVYAVEKITVDDKPYTLYTLLNSGELTVRDSMDMWMCGGGAGGQHGVSLYSGGTYYDKNRETNGGFGGGGGYSTSAILPKGTYAVTIGAGGTGNANGSSTKIDSNGTTYATIGGGKASGKGGSGGGAGGYGPNSSTKTIIDGKAGDGNSTYPFGISTFDAHCAGGGGGSVYFEYKNRYTHRQRGGDGGTNGGSGGSSSNINSTTEHSIGGVKGGGDGAAYGMNGEATAATFYGSGGGGGKLNQVRDSSTSRSLGQAGYQGIAYLLYPPYTSN